MKINININDNEPLYTVIDSVVIGYLKHSLELVNSPAFVTTHSDDIKQDAKIKKALLVLIEYYGG